MARKQKLKVFRTPIGFHDAYVAAPSQKAALEAWGADSNLFASGSAELVDAPELTREPLAQPGQVIRRLRGTLAEHVAALPKKSPRKAGGKSTPDEAAADASEASTGEMRKPAPKLRPRPKRTPLDRAEAALAAIEKQQIAEREVMARRQAALDEERRKLEARQERERGKLVKRLDTARDAYEQAMADWRGE